MLEVLLALILRMDLEEEKVVWFILIDNMIFPLKPRRVGSKIAAFLIEEITHERLTMLFQPNVKVQWLIFVAIIPFLPVAIPLIHLFCYGGGNRGQGDAQGSGSLLNCSFYKML
uniref:Uncharacterized protein n=1 Tax=Sphaerodactylus townsendi TaxID=933632 RepID=A0ACB8EMP3_9SAUR